MVWAEARLVIHSAGGADREEHLREGTVELGRSPQAGIRIAAREVSGRHAELWWDGGQLRMRDLGSLNGTYVNGRRLGGDWAPVADGDRIAWGAVQATAVVPPTHAPASATQPVRPGRSIPQVPQRTRGQRAPTSTAARQSAGRGRARQVFISHASEDKRWARDLAAALRQRGWEPWLDESAIQGGSSWAASIQAALRASSVMVLVVTSHSVAKGWVLDEVVAARNLGVPIIPAVLEEVRLPDELQFMLQRTQSVDIADITDSDGRNAALHRLDDALLGVLARAGRLNPDRVRMRIGRVLGALGVALVLTGFVGFIVSGFLAVDRGPTEAPVAVLAFFGVFIVGGLVGAVGSGLVRAGRAKGL